MSPPADNSPQIIEVTLTIGTSGQPAPGIGLTPNALTIDVVAGSNGASIFQVRNTGGGTLNWTAAADAPWLSVSPPSGANTATVSVAARADNLPAGNYTGRIAVSASGAANTPQTLNVTLRVSAAPSPTLALAPAALSFTALVDGGNPPAQRLDISNAGSGALSWRATAVTFNGGQWLAVSPESGAAPGRTSGRKV